MTLALVALIAALGAAGEDKRCTSGDAVRFAPGDMLAKAEAFRDGLAPPERQRLDQALPRSAEGRVAACAGRDGTACDVAATLAAFRRIVLMPSFLATLRPTP